MLLVYDHDNVLHITNEKGLRWNYDRADKPQFGFDYDHLFFVPHDDLFEFELNGETEPLNEEAQEEIGEYIKLCEPPIEHTMSKQFIEDIQEAVKERQEGILDKLGFYKFENFTEIMITAREGSNDPRRQIARRCLDWNDFLNGTAYRVCEEINATLDEDLKEYPHYRDMIPEVPPEDTFLESHWSDERFDKKVTDTLDVNGGEKDLGEDKRAV
tara:strand:+ start:268 stop:909 length:642 start_codon:yes stop_codon:yes gene_type:complete